jgi:hypothetical protein
MSGSNNEQVVGDYGQGDVQEALEYAGVLELEGVHLSKRRGRGSALKPYYEDSYFSKDGGQTWYDIDAPQMPESVGEAGSKNSGSGRWGSGGLDGLV